MNIDVKKLGWVHVEKHSHVYQEEADLSEAAPHLKGWKIRRINDWDAPNPLKDYDCYWTVRCNAERSETIEGTEEDYRGIDGLISDMIYGLRNLSNLVMLANENAYERAVRKHGIQMTYEDWCLRIIKKEYLIAGLCLGYQGGSVSLDEYSPSFYEGAAYIHKSVVEKEFSFDKEVPAEQKAWEYIRAVIEEASQRLEGDCWGVVVTRPDGVEHESLWGMIGWDDNANDFVSGNGLVPDAAENRELAELHGSRCVCCGTPTWNDQNRTFDDGPFRLTGTLCDECVAQEEEGKPIVIPGFMLGIPQTTKQVEMVLT